ncbi:hypothetical protein [Ekhidna sp.]|uniref:hypothetical protein n=1 Tax=Ekhidna sp. TaxID=2608089 RepID=UPI003298C105
MSNPVVQSINPSGATNQVATGHISCVTNAGFTQRAEVIVKDADQKVVAQGTFQGKGENNTPAPLQPSGGNVLQYTNAKLPLTLEATFAYDPNGSFENNAPNKVFTTIPFNDHGIEVATILSEDWVDNDFNDLVLRSITVAH